jgi:hypothetical protein
LPKIVEKVIELTYQSIKSSDQDFLDLFKLFHEQGVLEKNDELC